MKIVVFSLLALLAVNVCHGWTKAYGKYSTFTSLKKSRTNVCQVKIRCQIPLSNPSSKVTIGSTSVCDDTAKYEQTIDVGQGEDISLSKNVQPGDDFRVIIAEIPNSCSSTAGPGPFQTTRYPGPVTREPGDQNCLVIAGDLDGTFNSPGYPSNYPKNLDCKYTFGAKPGFCGIRMKFDRFSVDETADCEDDKLVMLDKPYCGEQLNGKSVLYPVPLDIKFKTDDKNPDLGFNAAYQYIKDCSHVCNKDLGKKVSSSLSPPTDTFGDFATEFDCNYKVSRADGVKCIKILGTTVFEKEDVGYININGVKYFKKNFEKPIFVNFDDLDSININAVGIKVKDKNITSFALRYTQVTTDNECPTRACAKTLTSVIGTLKNPGSPGPYPPRYRCVFRIHKNGEMTKALIGLSSKLPKGDTLTIIGGKALTRDETTEVKFDGDKDIEIEFKSDNFDETTFDLLVFQQK